ncbi:MAG TPA: hypothetical protein VFN68_17130, partial [Acidimicrobiales bacterium]|nr:hypothetical protein [Acidimicrobiales bacterium]
AVRAAPAGWVPAGPDPYRSAPPFPPAGGPHTDEFDAAPAPRRNHRTERRVGLVVLGLVIIGALVAAGLLTSGSHPGSAGNPTQPTTASGGTGPARHIARVSVYLSVTGHSLDNPNETPLTFDGNPATYWQSEVYTNPRFGNLYPGIGLVIDLGSSSGLHSLSVTSPTTGWAGSAYVSSHDVGVGQPLSDWGSPTATKSGISGSTELSLSGRHGRYVMLWITDLGPADTIKVAELAVR